MTTTHQKRATIIIDRKLKLVILYGHSPYDPYPELAPYEIDLNRIKTERDLLAWVRHLSEKSWITRDDLTEFITQVGEYKHFKIYGL